MPFPGELARGLAAVAYDRRWPGDFAVLARKFHHALSPTALRVSRTAHAEAMRGDGQAMATLPRLKARGGLADPEHRVRHGD